MSLISVIVPVYKVEKYLHRCVDSILRQTFTDFELILVDDGSPDNCGVICDEYAQKDNRVHVIHQKNGGMSAARNAGLDWIYANSDSEWISFVDSDDWVHEKYLEILYGSIVGTDKLVSICNYQETKGETLPKIIKENFQIVNTEEFYCEHNVNAAVAWGKLFKKECFANIRFPIGKLHEDEYTTYKTLFQNSEVVVITEKLYAYFMNPNGIMRSKWNKRRLDAVEAKAIQLRYFKKNKFLMAYQNSCLQYCNSLKNAILKMQQCEECSIKDIETYKRKLRKALVRYGKKAGISFSQEYCWIYELAFPKEMKVYWYCCAICDKVKKILFK